MCPMTSSQAESENRKSIHFQTFLANCQMLHSDVARACAPVVQRLSRPLQWLSGLIRARNEIQNDRLLLITAGKMVRLEEFSLQEREPDLNFPSDLLAIRWATTQEYVALEHYPFFCSLAFLLCMMYYTEVNRFDILP